jgi:hypothetical protein
MIFPPPRSNHAQVEPELGLTNCKIGAVNLRHGELSRQRAPAFHWHLRCSALCCEPKVEMEVTKMLSCKIFKKLITATTAAAIVAGALIISSPGRATADPYRDGARHEVYAQHDNGRHLGWDHHDRDFVSNDIRYTVVCDRDGDDCRTVPNYVAPGWQVFAPSTWFRR